MLLLKTTLTQRERLLYFSYLKEVLNKEHKNKLRERKFDFPVI